MDDDESLCANCGTDPDAAWPPTPKTPQEVSDGRAGESAFWLAFVMSCGFGFFLWVVAAFLTFPGAYATGSVHYGLKYNALCYGPVLLVQTAWYGLARPSDQRWAHGVGASVFVTLACFLGALATCQ